MLRREGYRDNHKRVYRLYREQGLSLRHKRPKRNKSAQRRQPKAVAQAINDIWSMDFVMDQLFDGRRLKKHPPPRIRVKVGFNLRSLSSMLRSRAPAPLAVRNAL